MKKTKEPDLVEQKWNKARGEFEDKKPVKRWNGGTLKQRLKKQGLVLK